MKKIKILSSFSLKVLAIIFMLCDHLWATVIPGNTWLTNIGRIAFPLFAFQIVEGFFHTKDINKYIKRMFIFGLISEIPYNLMTGGSLIYPFQQNVLFTFTIALLFLKKLEKSKNKGKKSFIITSIISLLLGFIIGTITMVDYFGFGVITVILIYLCHDLKYKNLFILLSLILVNCFFIKGQEIPFTLFNHEFFFPLQGFAVLAIIPILLYNGKKGFENKYTKYLFYIFYPLHMLILSIIGLYIIK